MPRAEWYYIIGGQQFGPVSPSILKELAAKGELKPADLVWRPGLPSWVPARKVRGIFPPSPPEPPPEADTRGPEPEKVRPSDLPEGTRTGDQVVKASERQPGAIAQRVRIGGAKSAATLDAEGSSPAVSSFAENGFGVAPGTAGSSVMDLSGVGEQDVPAQDLEGVGPGSSTSVFGGPGNISRGEIDRPSKNIVSLLPGWVGEMLDQIAYPMPYVFFGGALGGLTLLVVAGLVMFVKGEKPAVLFLLSGTLMCGALGVIAWPLARALVQVSRLSRSIQLESIPAVWGACAAGAIWICGLSNLLFWTYLADLWHEWTFLLTAFVGFGLAQFVTGSILTASPRWELPQKERRPETLLGEGSRVRATLLGCTGKILGQSAPVIAASFSVVGALIISFALISLLSTLHTASQTSWDHAWDRGGSGPPPPAVGMLREILAFFGHFAIFFVGFVHIVIAYFVALFSAIIIPICHLGWHLGEMRFGAEVVTNPRPLPEVVKAESE